MADTNGDGAKPRRIYNRLAKPPTRLSGRFYSVAEASELLDVSKQRVLVYLGEGRLTGVMVGNVWLIAACSVERLAELRDVATIAEAFTEGGEPMEVTG